MKKINLDEEIKKEIIDENVSRLLKYKLVYINIFSLIISILILIISIVNINKVKITSSIFENIIGINNGMLILLLLTNILSIILITIQIVYNIYNIYLKNNWEKQGYKLYKILDIPTFIMSCFYILCFVISLIATPCNVSGDSMNNTLHNNDRLICSGLFYEPEINDIVVFDSFNYNGENTLFIKRVLGVEGSLINYNEDTKELFIDNEFIEKIELNQYLVIKNDLELLENNYYIPKDMVLVLGDNRGISFDSRYFGLVNESDILGKILFRIHPFTKINEEILN